MLMHVSTDESRVRRTWAITDKTWFSIQIYKAKEQFA
jgi:hypothetical protein